jgi:hypothetical protein
MNWLKWIMFALQLFTQVAPMVIAAEQAVGTGNGEIKKDLVTGSAVAAATLAGASTTQITAVEQITGSLVDATVTALNTAGVLAPKPAELK